MDCSNCGATIPAGYGYCPRCGKTVERAAPVEPVVEPVMEAAPVSEPVLVSEPVEPVMEPVRAEATPAMPAPADYVYTGGEAPPPRPEAAPAPARVTDGLIARERSCYLHRPGHCEYGAVALTAERLTYYRYPEGMLRMYGTTAPGYRGERGFEIPLSQVDHLEEITDGPYVYLAVVTTDRRCYPLFFDKREDWKRAILHTRDQLVRGAVDV